LKAGRYHDVPAGFDKAIHHPTAIEDCTLSDFRQTHATTRAHVFFKTRIVEVSITSWQYDVMPDRRFLINSLPSNTASLLTLISC
jgi:hypothetical protein